MNKGFTLVELLGVIIILGVLTLIVTVSVNGVLTNSKNSLSEIQIKNIEEAAQTYYLNHGISESYYDKDVIKTCVNVSELIDTGYIDSTVISNPKNDEDMIGSVKITYDSVIYTYEYQDTACSNDDLGIICESASEETEINSIENYVAGDKYTCKVKNDGTSYTFYVLGTEGDNVNLILDRNVYYNSDEDTGLADSTNKGLVAWQTSGSNTDGPVTTMDYLYNATKSWTNIPDMIMNYADEGNTGNYGYGTIITTDEVTKITKNDGSTITVLTDQEGYTNLKARLPYESEVSNYNEESNNAYLYDNLDSEGGITYSGNITGIYGYWTISSSTSDSLPNVARDVYYHGNVTNVAVDYDGYGGVRPVITIPKQLIK